MTGFLKKLPLFPSILGLGSLVSLMAMTATAIPMNSPKQKLIPIVHESSIMNHDKDMRRNISIKSVAFWEEEFPKY